MPDALHCFAGLSTIGHVRQSLPAPAAGVNGFADSALSDSNGTQQPAISTVSSAEPASASAAQDGEAATEPANSLASLLGYR